MTTPDPILGRLMLAFDGFEPSSVSLARLRAAPAAGLSLFRAPNVGSAGQVRELTAAWQGAAADGGWPGPLLIAADQEGGQFLALGPESTPFAGNLALGAVGDADLAERVGAAIGREALAMGVNVVYAPCCDLATNAANPALGIRSFGDDPIVASLLAAATVRGLRSAGVAATAKHFPGLGEATSDSHHGLPSIEAAAEALAGRELQPFEAAIDAGVDLVMSAHIAVPALTGVPAVPATLSRLVMTDLLRNELGFSGLTITDALDMGALAQGDGQVLDAIAAIRAGVDLLLLAIDEPARERLEAGLVHAAARGLLAPADLAAPAARLARLRARLAGVAQPDLSVVASDAHRALARELAERSITLVRDDAGLLPLRLRSEQRVLAVMPRPADLTPADTSSSVEPMLAEALRAHHGAVDEIVTPQAPSPAEIGAIRDRATAADLVVIGTLAASFVPAQAAMVEAVLATGAPTVTVALRTPWDLAAYPRAAVQVATYGILRPSLDAFAAALFGQIDIAGRLPVAIDGIAQRGHGLRLAVRI